MAWFLSWIAVSAALAAAAAASGLLNPRAGRMAVRHVIWWVAALAIAGALFIARSAGDVPAPARVATAPPGMVPEDGRSSPIVVPPLPDLATQVFVAVWIAGAVAGAAVLVIDLRRLRRLRQACRPMTPETAARFSRAFALSRQGRRVTFVWCPFIDRPAMIGLGRALLALPTSHAGLFEDEETDRILLHELAHARRFDDLARLAERWLGALLWVNPVVHVVLSRLDLTREMACDDWAVAHGGDPVAYVRTLASVARLEGRAASRWLPAAATGAPGTLTRRARRLLGRSYSVRAGSPAVVQAGASLLAAAFAVTLLHLPPAFVDGAEGDHGARAVEREAPALVAPARLIRAAAAVPSAAVGSPRGARPDATASRVAGPPSGARQRDDVVRGAGAVVEQAAVTATPERGPGSSPSIVEPSVDAPAGAPPLFEAGPLASARVSAPMSAPLADAREPDMLPALREPQPRWWSGFSGAATSTAAYMTRIGTAIAKPFSD